MQKQLLLFLFVTITFVGFSQKDISSLRNEIKAETSDTQKINLYIYLSNSFEKTNFDSALVASKKALELAKKIKQDVFICKANIKTGIVLQNSGNYNAANIYFFEGLKIAEKINAVFLQAQAYNAIGNSFSYQKQNAEAIKNYQLALNLFSKAGAHKKTGVVLMNLAGVYYLEEYDSRDFKLTHQNYKAAVDSCIKYNDIDNLITIYGNLSIVYSDEGDHKQALEVLKKATDLAQKQNYTYQLVSLYYDQGRTYSYLKDHKKAEEFFKKSIELCKQFEDADYLSENYLAMAENYNDAGNSSLAYEFIKKHKDISDSLFNAQTTQQLNELKTRYETEKKEERIKQLQIEHDFQQKSKWYVFAFAVLVIIMLGLIISRLSFTKRKQAELHEKEQQLLNTKQELTESELRSAKQVLELREQELFGYTQSLIEKNNFIEQLQEKITAADPETFLESNQGHIQELLHFVILTEDDWEKFKGLFNNVHKGFFVRLKENYADLTQAEIRLCALTRLKLSSKEIAQLLGISPTSVNTTRYRLRKKLNLQEEDSFEDLILKV